MSIDFEKVLKEKLHEDAFAFITSSEKEFADWIERVRWQSKRCDELAWELKRIKDKEEQGLLKILPVAEGTKVWRIAVHSGGGRIPNWYEKYETEFVLSMLWEWGITVFATESEAEEALARMKGE